MMLSFTVGFIVVHADSLQLKVRIALVASIRLDAMLIRDHFPKLKFLVL
jgi:hypothetical protein